MTPAGYATIILQWNTWDGQNLSGAVFTLSGPQTYTVNGNSTGYAVQTVQVGTYTISVTHAGSYQGDASKSLIAESTQSYYVQFYGASPSVQVAEGTGISIAESGNIATIGLKSGVVSAGTVGGSTAVPVLTFDTYGRCTSKSYRTIYPPTTAGTAGQVWTSDGSGQGYWGTADGSPAISDVVLTRLNYVNLISNTDLRANGVDVSVSWNVNSNVLNGRRGTLNVVGSAILISQGSLADYKVSYDFSITLTNSQLLKGTFSGWIGSSDADEIRRIKQDLGTTARISY